MLKGKWRRREKGMIMDLFDRRREAMDYLDKKGIRNACLHHIRLFRQDEEGHLMNLLPEQRNEPNVLYVAKKGTAIYTPVDNDKGGLVNLEKCRQAGQIIAEIPFTGDDHNIYIEAARVVKLK